MPVVFFSDHHDIPLPAGHKFPLAKYRLAREILERDGRFELRPAPLAEPEEIAQAHDPGYVSAFLNGTLDAAAVRRIGFPWSEGLVARTLASAGSTLAALEQAESQGWGGGLAGGTHHAFREYGAGFCVFNDIAIATARIREARPSARVSVVDLDVHQGDGTAAMLAGDPAAFTVSVHCRNNFPFRKQISSLDLELDDGAEDADYLAAAETALEAALAFEPETVFFQAGVDALATDKLGRLRVTAAGLQQRDRMVLEACRNRGIPVVITLGGGYSDPIEHSAAAHAAVFQTAADVFRAG